MSEFNANKLEPFWESWYIEDLLGEGSYGYVYKIFKEEFGKKYYSALKIIPIPRTKSEEKQLYYEGLDQDTATEYFKDIVEVIFREIGIMAELKGRTNIVSLEDHKVVPKEDGPGFYLLIRMELLVNIDEYQLKHPFTIQDVIRMGKDVCKALILCGKRNIIHRDIKPGNIFVTEDGDFKLGDFGISRQLEGTGEGLSIKGTYGYMAPEVYFGKPYDTRADIYSLGMVLYYFLNKKRGPFSMADGSVPKYSQRQEALTRRFQGEALPKPFLASEELAAVVLKACEFDIENRYTTPEEFLKALEELSKEAISDELIEQPTANEEGILRTVEPEDQTIHLSAIGITKTEEIPKEEKPEVVEEPVVEEAEIPKKSKKGLILACFIFGALCIAAVVIFLLNKDKFLPASSKEAKITPTIAVTQPPATPVPTLTPTPSPAPTATPTPVPEYKVVLDQTGIADFNQIEKVEDITILSAAMNEISSLKELSKSTFLTYLDLHDNKISKLDGLENFTQLSYLDLSSNQLEKIDEVSNLALLEVIILSNNKISDLQPLRELPNVSVLYLSDNKEVDNLSALKNWSKLEILTLDNTNVTDLSPLYQIHSLEALHIANTNISEEEIKELKTYLPNCEIVK